jgi:hypothetical protein
LPFLFLDCTVRDGRASGVRSVATSISLSVESRASVRRKLAWTRQESWLDIPVPPAFNSPIGWKAPRFAAGRGRVDDPLDAVGVW